MKKTLSITLTSIVAICLASSLSGCQKDETPAVAKFSLDYSIAGSGSMTKGNAYDDLYDKLIQTRKITPTHYNITFTLEGKDEPALAHEGYWQNKEFFALPVGTYKVKGRSEGLSADRADTLSLAFDHNITIEANTDKITLKADYASCMLIFDSEKIQKINISHLLRSVPIAVSDKVDNKYYYCCFDYDDAKWNTGEEHSGGSRMPLYINITKTDNTSSKIPLTMNNYENGKYYYYKSVEGGFELAKMEAGN